MQAQLHAVTTLRGDITLAQHFPTLLHATHTTNSKHVCRYCQRFHATNMLLFPNDCCSCITAQNTESGSSALRERTTPISCLPHGNDTGMVSNGYRAAYSV